MDKQKLIEIAKDTISIINKKEYIYKSKKVILPDYYSKLWSNIDTNKHIDKNKSGKTIFDLSTTVNEVIKLKNQNKTNICVLNFASAKHPGGGFLNGSKAQEESLARTSNLYLSLIDYQKNFYDKNIKNNNPLYTDDIIYSKNISFFKNDNGILLDSVVCSDVITSPAVNAGIARRNKINEAMIRNTMQERIRKIIYVAAQNNVDYLVLGEFGCGVFENDLRDVAKMFYQVLEKENMKVCFKEIIFAIYDTESNFKEFKVSYFKGGNCL